MRKQRFELESCLTERERLEQQTKDAKIGAILSICAGSIVWSMPHEARGLGGDEFIFVCMGAVSASALAFLYYGREYLKHRKALIEFVIKERYGNKD